MLAGKKQTIGKTDKIGVFTYLVMILNLLGGHRVSYGSDYMYRLTAQENASTYIMLHAISGGP